MKKCFDVFVYSGFFSLIILISLFGGSSVTWQWHILNFHRMVITFAYLMGGIALASLPSLVIAFVEEKRG